MGEETRETGETAEMEASVVGVKGEDGTSSASLLLAPGGAA